MALLQAALQHVPKATGRVDGLWSGRQRARLHGDHPLGAVGAEHADTALDRHAHGLQAARNVRHLGVRLRLRCTHLKQLFSII